MFSTPLYKSASLTGVARFGFDRNSLCHDEHSTYEEAKLCAGRRGVDGVVAQPDSPDALVMSLRRFSCCGALRVMPHRKSCGNFKPMAREQHDPFPERAAVRYRGEVDVLGEVAVGQDGRNADGYIPVKEVGKSGLVPWTYCQDDEIELVES